MSGDIRWMIFGILWLNVVNLMNIYIKRLFCILFLILCFFNLNAAEFVFRQLSVSDGFPPSIQYIYAEDNGYVWIVSKQGLGRFDGYELKTYSYEEGNPYSLPGNQIYAIEEDSLHNLWVLSDSGVVNYQRHTDRFIPVLDEHGDTFKATAVCKLPGRLLLAGHGQIYQYSYQERKIRTLHEIKVPSSFSVREMLLWDEHTLLCMESWKGILCIDLRTGEKKPSPFPDGNDITHALIDETGSVWTTSYNRGVTCYDRKGNIKAVYTTENSALSHNVILCLSENNGKIWAGTDGGGINIIDSRTGNVTVLKHLSGDDNSLPINSIQCLFQRKGEKNVWVGSVKGGLINIRPSIVCSYTDVPLGFKTGLSEKAVLSFYQESDSKEIWIGTDGGGVNRFNPITKEFVHYPSTYGEKVVSLCGYSQDELLISLFSKGVFFFNKHTGQIRSINEKGEIINKIALYSRKGINLYQDDTKSILILSSDIHRYYWNDGRVQQLNDKGIPIEGQVIPFGYDSLKTYLYDLKRIYALDHRNNKIEIIYTSSRKNDIECVAKDAHGIFWIGFSNQIFRYDVNLQQETLLETHPLRNITALVCDNQQRLWIGTNEELFVWLDKEKKLISLDKSDGAENNEFLKKAVWVSRQGDIYMGGINGMLYVDGQKTDIEIPNPPVIELADVISNNKSCLSEIEDGLLKLNFENKALAIKVMAHESNVFRKRVYRWHIYGHEDFYIDTTSPEIIMRSLTPGTYHVSVACTTKDGVWTKSYPVLSFRIHAVWYKTWWFTLLWIVLLAGLLIIGILYLLNRKEERLREELQAHKQKIYEEKVRFLININHELRTPLTLIYTPLCQLMKNMSKDNPAYPTLRSIFKQSKRMKELLNMVLNLRKMEVEQSKLNLKSYLLNDWIKEIASDFKYEEEEKHITFVYEFSSNIEYVPFDSEKHMIILTNLIVNALKHSPLNSKIILRTELTDNRSAVRISVIDQGRGLQGVDTQKLFTRFYQGENEKEGTGIGLSYSKILVEMHHGHIGVYNNEEGGACFYYELPLHAEASVICSPQEYLNAPALTGQDKLIPVANSIDTRNYSCLFVDDNEGIRQMMLDALKDEFRNLYIASDGREALDIALKEIPDVVVSDIMMPGMNGYELCRNIKENVNINHIQVILLTARTDEQSHVDSYRTGADAYMEKPFEISSLLESIRNRLFLREQMKERYTLNSVTVEGNQPVSSADDAFLFKLNKLIMENMDNEGLNIEFLCQNMGVSRASLYNRLKSLTSMGANEYVNKLRIEKSMELLRNTEMSITEVAERMGFSSSRYFSTAFKKYTGITPTQFKESAGKSDN